MANGIDAAIRQFSRDNVIAKGRRHARRSWAKPMTINGRQIHDFWLSASPTRRNLRANGAWTVLTVVDDYRSAEAIRSELVEKPSSVQATYVIVAYRRRRK